MKLNIKTLLLPGTIIKSFSGDGTLIDNYCFLLLEVRGIVDDRVIYRHEPGPMYDGFSYTIESFEYCEHKFENGTWKIHSSMPPERTKT